MNNKKSLIFICLCAAMISALFGCAFFADEDKNSGDRAIRDEVVTQESFTEKTVTEESAKEEKTTKEKVTKKETTEAGTEKEIDQTEETKESSEENTDEDIPEYSGKAYIELNDNIPNFTESEKESKESFENYSDLDSLGRCGAAFANLSPELLPTEERGSIGDIRPSGWHTVKYPEVIEDNYLYNRSHLIAFSLAGENANEKNLITGTRYLNQETMQMFELPVLDYVKSTGNHVLYRVTPVFEGEDLLARGVHMEAWSVEDSGKGICFNVFCYNVQPHIDIDYSTGESHISEDFSEMSTEITTQPGTEAVTEAPAGNNTENGADYIVNTNTRKIHLPTCSSVNDMAEHNKWYFTGTLDELKGMGYTPCGRCLAQYR